MQDLLFQRDEYKRYMRIGFLERYGVARGDAEGDFVDNLCVGRGRDIGNPPPEFANMSISQQDVTALVAFLQSLTEDYDDI